MQPMVGWRYHTGVVPLPDGAQMPYLRLGTGSLPLLVIPGAGDGMATAHEAARRLAWFFRSRRHDYHLLYLSRRQPIPRHFTIEQHADDYAWALDHLQQPPLFVECNSAGGPIGQWLAVKRPDWVRGLILSVTLHYANDHFRHVVGYWADLARQQQWAELNWSSVEHTFRPQTMARFRPFRAALRLVPKPRDPHRIVHIFEELLHLDQRALVAQITCPTLVIGGEQDRVIDAAVQRDMAARIPNSHLVLYPAYGHGNDQENPDYRVQVNQFIQAIR